MRFDPAHFIFIRPDTIKICAVRPGEKITRLEEMHVGIDITRKDEFSVTLDPAGTHRDTALFAAGDALDFVAINYKHRLSDDLAVRRLNYGGANHGNYLIERTD